MAAHKFSLSAGCFPSAIRSCFSLLGGALSPEEIVSFAQTQGFPCVGMTDVNNLYGLVRFIKASGEAGIRPLAGAILAEKGLPACTVHILNQEGMSRLCTILTRSLARKTAAAYFPGNVIPFSGCYPVPVSLLDDLVQDGWDGLHVAASPDFISKLLPRGPENLGVAIPFGQPFTASVSWAREHKIPAIAMPGGNVLTEDDAHLVRLMRAIDLCVPLERLPAQEARNCAAIIPAPGAIASFYSAIPEALESLAVLAAKTDCAGLLSSRAIFPLFDNMPEGESFRKLDSLCRRGVEKRYGVRIDAAGPASAHGKKIMARLSYELSIIREKGFAGYFLVVHDIVSRCPRTTGRGSAAASIVSFLLGITHVDPLRYNLFFERFLNRGRNDPPDIDVDFPWDEREKALSYVFTRYAGHAGMVADHVTFGPRSSLREPAKALGFPEQETGRLVRLYTAGEHRQIPEHLLVVAKRLRGIPRYIGTHPGGVVITPRPLFRYTHLQISQLGWPVIAWEKDAAEDAGLVKIDLLGNRSLGVLRDSIRLVNIRHAANISWRRFDPTEDAETVKMLERGETVGVFYIESPATRQLLQKMRHADFQRLVIASSIIRPAANRYIEEFVRRLHGKKWKRLHQAVEETLKETYGIMVFQEDVSRVAIAAAGFSAEEADKMRKVLSKKAGKEGLGFFQKKFAEGARRTGLSGEEILAVWDMVMSFDGYSFCKPHSASYAQVSFRCAYLKRCYPLEFMASVINNGGGFYTRQTYINETRRMGIRVLGPDVAKSGLEYLPEGDGLRTGLGQLVGIRRGFLVKLLGERERHGPFADFQDFLRRTNPGYSDLRVLIRSGALDSLSQGLFRPALFWLAAQHDRFSGMIFPPEIPSSLGDYSWQQKLADEVEFLGLMESRHPLAVFEPRIRTMARRMPDLPRVSSRLIPEYKDKRIGVAGMLCAAKEVRTCAKQEMMFLSFEDEEGTFEAVAFPEVYEKYRFLIESSPAFFVTGVVKNDLGAWNIELEGLFRLTRDSGRSLPGHEYGYFRGLSQNIQNGEVLLSLVDGK